MFYLGLDRVRLGPNVSAGMNYMLIGVLAYKLRTSMENLEPIKVRRVDDVWQVVDGRHRLVAHMVAGRHTIFAVVVD